MKLINTQTNKVEEVQDFEDRLFEGTHGLVSGENYNIIDQDYNVVNVGADEAMRMFQDGSSFADEEDIREQQIRDIESDPVEMGKAALESVAEGISFGASTGKLVDAGIINPDAYFLRKEAFPITTTVGDITGSLALGGGLGALGKAGAKFLVKQGAKQAAKKISGAGVKYGGLSAFESGMRGLGDYYSETELYDDEWNAESAVARTTAYGLLGGTLGYAGGKAVQKLIKPKKIEEVLRKHGSITEGDEMFKDLGVDSLGMTRKDKVLGLKGVDILHDQDGSLYNKMGKSKIAISPEFEKDANILDMTSKEQLDAIGKKFGVRSLYDEIYEDSTLSEALAGGSVRFTDLIHDVRKTKMDMDMLDDLTMITEGLKAGKASERNAIIKELGKSTKIGSRLRKEIVNNPEDKYLRTALKNNERRSGRAFKKLRNLEKKKLVSNKYSEVINDYRAQEKELFRQLDDELNQIDGFKLKNRYFVTRPQVLDNHLEAMVRETADEGMKKSTKHLLKAIGFTKRNFQKFGPAKRDGIADMVFKLRGKQGERSLTSKIREIGQTPLDSKYIDKNIEIMKNNSLYGIDNALNRIQNNLPESQVIDRRLGGARIKKIILKAARREMSDPDTGNIDAVFKGAWEKIVNFANDVEAQRWVDGVDTPFDLNSLRRFKTNLGNKVKTWETNDQGIDKAVLKDIYFELNNHIEKLARDHNLGSIADELKMHNKNYHLSTIIEKSIKSKLAGEMAKGDAGMMSFLSGVMTSASASSMGFLPAMALGKVATISRDFMKSHGDEIMAAFYRQQELANISTQKALKKSSIGFVKNFNKRISTAVLTSQLDSDNVKDIYRRDREQLEQAIQDPNDLLDRFTENNKQMAALLPEVSVSMFNKVNSVIEFLADKFPTSNNDDGLDYDFIPSDREVRKYHRYRNAAINPMKVIKNSENGYMSIEERETLRVLYPSLYKTFLRHLSISAADPKVSRSKRKEILRFIGTTSNTLKENRNRELMNNLRTGAIEQQETSPQQAVSAPTESMQKKRYNNTLTQAQRIQER